MNAKGTNVEAFIYAAQGNTEVGLERCQGDLGRIGNITLNSRPDDLDLGVHFATVPELHLQCPDEEFGGSWQMKAKVPSDPQSLFPGHRSVCIRWAHPEAGRCSWLISLQADLPCHNLPFSAHLSSRCAW